MLQVIAILILSIFYQDNCLADYATVTLLKGSATQLASRAFKATKLHIKEKVQEGASIVTYEKSFIRLEFSDGHKLSIGPNSKVVLKRMGHKESSVIDLLKGKLRAQLKKHKGNDQYKMLIKTRTAAMGIRGTTLQGVYNPKNKVTSLLTLEGKVDMVKIPRNEVLSNSEKINETLKKEQKVTVREGRFSSTLKKQSKATIPVKISPHQYKVLATKDDGGIKLAENKVEKKLKSSKLEKILDPNPKGTKDIESGILAPRAGGYLDLNTGLYIPPAKTAKFNEKEDVFAATKDIGKVDPNTGDYIPPRGLIVDANKGLVIDRKTVKSKILETKLLAKAQKINNDIINDNNIEKGISEKKKNYAFFFDNKNSFGIEFLVFRDHLKNERKSDKVQATLKSNRNTGFLFKYRHLIHTNLFALFNIGLVNYSFKNPGTRSFIQKNSNYVYLYLGMGKRFTNHLKLKFAFIYSEEPLYGDSQNINVVKFKHYKLAPSLGYTINLDKRYTLNPNLTLFLHLPLKSKGIKKKSGGGVKIDIGLYKLFKLGAKVGIKLFAQMEKINTDTAELDHNQIGSQLNFSLSF